MKTFNYALLSLLIAYFTIGQRQCVCQTAFSRFAGPEINNLYYQEFLARYRESGGVYFCKISEGNYSVTIKMILEKQE